MEWPRAVNFIYPADGHRLCTMYITYFEQKDCTARFATGERDSRLKSKSGSSSHTGGTVCTLYREGHFLVVYLFSGVELSSIHYCTYVYSIIHALISERFESCTFRKDPLTHK